MKQIASNYTYSPTTNVVTLTGVNIDQDQLLLVVAPQVGRTMYNFASGVTGAVSAGADTRVTLNASTVGLTTTSPLVIFYDDQAAAQAVTGTVALDPASLIALENVTVTIGSSVTIAGTVTANLNDDNFAGALTNYIEAASSHNAFPVEIAYQPSVTIGSLPAISGTVTVGSLPNGALTTRFGSVVTANLAAITSAVTNTSRKYLLAQNISAGTVTIGIGFSPTTTQGIQLTAGAGLTFDAFCPTGAVYWLGAVTGATWTILEG